MERRTSGGRDEKEARCAGAESGRLVRVDSVHVTWRIVFVLEREWDSGDGVKVKGRSKSVVNHERTTGVGVTPRSTTQIDCTAAYIQVNPCLGDPFVPNSLSSCRSNSNDCPSFERRVGCPLDA